MVEIRHGARRYPTAQNGRPQVLQWAVEKPLRRPGDGPPHLVDGLDVGPPRQVGVLRCTANKNSSSAVGARMLLQVVAFEEDNSCILNHTLRSFICRIRE